MLPLKDYAARQWLVLQPIDHRLRRGRNRLVMVMHRRRRAEGQAELIGRLRARCAGRALAITIAFNTPGVIAVWVDRMLRLAPDAVPLICDNSSRPAERRAIETLCREAGVAYIAIPPPPVLKTKNGGLSHGMALTWVFHMLIKAIEPAAFAFLDHDLFPVMPVDFLAMVAGQSLYGYSFNGRGGGRGRDDPWSLWAGFCVYRYADVAAVPLDFTSDHSIGLDTGGQNWAVLYRHLDRAKFRFTGPRREVVDLGGDHRASLDLIDRFAHLGDAAGRRDRGETFLLIDDVLRHLERRLAAGNDDGRSRTTSAVPDAIQPEQ